MSEVKNINRYSEADLEVFKILIEKKLAKATKQLEFLDAQIEEAAETKDAQGDWMDDSSNNSDLDMLHTMANRQRRHILDLKNALQRVYNKSYGICVISGELIDKRRLLAVPTTTKSLEAKLSSVAPVEKIKPTKKTPAQPKIISRVVSKPPSQATLPIKDDWEEEDEELSLEIDEVIDLDSYSGEDLD